MSKATGPCEENIVVRKISTSKAQGGIGLIRRVPLALVREGQPGDTLFDDTGVFMKHPWWICAFLPDGNL